LGTTGNSDLRPIRSGQKGRGKWEGEEKRSNESGRMRPSRLRKSKGSNGGMERKERVLALDKRGAAEGKKGRVPKTSLRAELTTFEKKDSIFCRP